MRCASAGDAFLRAGSRACQKQGDASDGEQRQGDSGFLLAVGIDPEEAYRHRGHSKPTVSERGGVARFAGRGRA